MIIYHGAKKQNQNLDKAIINLLYMISYRFFNTLFYLSLTIFKLLKDITLIFLYKIIY